VAIGLLLDDIFTLLIFMLTFNSVIAATFLIGMVWRRATRRAAWVSIVVTTLFTLLLPVLLPMIPSLRTNDYLAMRTQGYVVERAYSAKEFDVEARAAEIALWDTLYRQGKSEEPRPATLEIGERFMKSNYIRPESIFWQNGLSLNANGVPTGSGLLKVELVVLSLLGLDLQANRHAVNETMTAVLRLIIPFGLLLGLSLITRPEPKQRLDFFYARLRTPAYSDHVEDRLSVERVRQNPALQDHLRLMPGTNWEFRKWTRTDWVGHGYVMLASLGIVALLYLIVNLGS
jgi:SSS family solute:Na+ symporter